MKKLAPLTRAIRLYSSTGGVELVPPIADEFGLKVTVGAWIDKNVERNEREMLPRIDLAKHNSNVNRRSSSATRRFIAASKRSTT